jgi:hypothetical protein
MLPRLGAVSLCRDTFPMSMHAAYPSKASGQPLLKIAARAAGIST